VYADPSDCRSVETSERPNGDAALQQEVTYRLSRSPFAGLRQVRCDTRQGAVILRGSVSSFYLKQMATAIGRQVAGVRAIRNELYVGMV
jgi:osmotically-inducible protein OsmY